MHRLYWHPWFSSYAPMAVLEEIGVKNRCYHPDRYSEDASGAAGVRRRAEE